MGLGRLTGLLLSGLLLLSLLSLTASLEPFQPEYEGDSVTDLSAQQISALEELPDSVNVGGRSGGSSGQAWGWKSTVPEGDVNAIAPGPGGTLYITGSFKGSATFDNTLLISTQGEYTDIFVAMLSSDGSWLWAVKAGGPSDDIGIGIAVGPLGNAYVTGQWGHNWGQIGNFVDADKSIAVGSTDELAVFYAKLSIAGYWEWALSTGGGSSPVVGQEIDVDSSGEIYVTGYFEGTAQFGGLSLNSSGEKDIFVGKLDGDGSWLWVVKAGGSGVDSAGEIAVDYNGNSYVSGEIGKTSDQGSPCATTATFGNINLTSGNCGEGFVGKLDSNGSWLWVVHEAVHWEQPKITIDSSANIYVTGNFWGTQTFGDTSLTSHNSGYYDMFIAKLNSSGSWQWAVKVTGPDQERQGGISTDWYGNIYVTGHFYDWVDISGTSLTTNGGNDLDFFIAKLDRDGLLRWMVKSPDLHGQETVRGIVVDSSSNAYVNIFDLSTGNYVSQIGPDSDGDDVLDSSDQCPGHDDSVDVDADGTPDGCDPLVDSDSDGVADSLDLCPGHDDSVDVDTDETPDGCDSLIDSDSDGVADISDQCPGHDDSVDVDADGIVDGCDPLVDSDSDGVADSSDQCPGYDDSVDIDSDGTPDGCDSLIEPGLHLPQIVRVGAFWEDERYISVDWESTTDPSVISYIVHVSTDYYEDTREASLPSSANNLLYNRVTIDGEELGLNPNADCFVSVVAFDGVVHRYDVTPVRVEPYESVDAGLAVVGIDCDFWCQITHTKIPEVLVKVLVICLLVLLVIGYKKHSGRRGQLNRPFIGTPPAVGGQGMIHQATPVSNSTQQQDDLQSNIKQMELRRQQAEYEADLLRKQLSDSVSFTALQNQEMQAEMARLQQTVERADQEKAAMLGELENAKESTSIVQHITYNIQDSAISGDISSIGLNEKDD